MWWWLLLLVLLLVLLVLLLVLLLWCKSIAKRGMMLLSIISPGELLQKAGDGFLYCISSPV
jgi:hypothetical protein